MASAAVSRVMSHTKHLLAILDTRFAKLKEDETTDILSLWTSDGSRRG